MAAHSWLMNTWLMASRLMYTVRTCWWVRVHPLARKCPHWIALLLIAGCGTSEPAQTTPSPTAHGKHITSGVVEDVIDGDTIRLRIGGNTETVRLIAIDTPETKHPTKRVECYGPQASEFLSNVLAINSTVRIERDIEARDAYGRLLLYVFLRTATGEIFVNQEMVLRGYARPLNIAPNSRYQQHIVSAAFDAQRHARGLWKHCK